jgi:hypothetical protein
MINNDIAIELLNELIFKSVNLTEDQKDRIKEVIKLLGGGLEK